MPLNLYFDQNWKKFQNPGIKFQTFFTSNSGFIVPKNQIKIDISNLEFGICASGISVHPG
ncbi:MAG: hypothetical protein EA359_06110 [Balneolaceae bacterium]|nr:MAG: hypothetical protein EA359_06110 [Balneolaceae bacterium]